MTDTILVVLLWIVALGAGLIAGLFFAFSTFVMTALAGIGAPGAAAMRAINTTILRSLFVPLFFGTALAGLLAAVLGALRWSEPVGWLAAASGLLYVVGTFLATIVFNVPLNTALDRTGPGSAEEAALWARYVVVWTRWNHVRTLAATAAAAAAIAALGMT